MPNKLELKIKKLFKDYTCEIKTYTIILTKKINKTKNKIITIDKICGAVECAYEKNTAHSTRYELAHISSNEIKNLSKIIKLIEKIKGKRWFDE